MSYVNINSFTTANRISFPSNLPARTGLLAELDRKMKECAKEQLAGRANCPEHLYSIDDTKMDAARGLDR